MIYLDNAATTLKKPQQVIDAVVKAMTTMGNAGRGAHEATLLSSRIIFDARQKLAEFFHAEDARQIVFTANATESFNIAIRGSFQPGDHVITTQLEHNSVLRPLYDIERQGVKLSIVKCDSAGRIRNDDIEAAIQKNTKAVICTHGSNLTGNLTDLTGIQKIVKKHDLLFIVDASQTVGVFPIDVQKLQIDILCFTGHKSLLGPQGTGGLYVRTGLNLRPLKTGGSGVQTYSKIHPQKMPTALEAGTLNGHGIAGLSAAVDYIREIGMDAIQEREQFLAKKFYDGICDLRQVKIYGDFSDWNRCPIISLNIGDYDSAEVSDELYMTYGIATRPGAHCAPLMHEALGTVTQGAVRFSFSHMNTEQEVEQAIRAVRELV